MRHIGSDQQGGPSTQGTENDADDPHVLSKPIVQRAKFRVAEGYEQRRLPEKYMQWRGWERQGEAHLLLPSRFFEQVDLIEDNQQRFSDDLADYNAL